MKNIGKVFFNCLSHLLIAILSVVTPLATKQTGNKTIVIQRVSARKGSIKSLILIIIVMFHECYL